MTEILPFIKQSLQEVPYPIGKGLAHWRFDLRPGIGFEYKTKRRDLVFFEEFTPDQQKRYIFEKVQTSLQAADKLPFYQRCWASTNIKLGDIRSFDDLKKLPIVSKEDLREAELIDRSRFVLGRYAANTGGTSGSPLGFYITPKLIPNEWAHMHRIWEKLGYRTTDLKLVIAGRNIGLNPLIYDGLRHSLLVNMYAPMSEVCEGLREWIEKVPINYLHGYPSAIAEFGRQLAELAPDVIDALRLDLKGAFLGSEYPAPSYRQVIEEVFQTRSVSWYGHTERCVLAWEQEEAFVYYPFQTYGFAEAVWDEGLDSWKLVGTSYGNQACPFIRYDTGDLIEPIEVEDGLLRSFRIKEGRIGDFVIDRGGQKIPLTSLIFGRHHKVFEFATHVQVKQEHPGELTVFVALGGNYGNSRFEQVTDNLDLDNLNLDIEVICIENPVRTPAGKVPLKVPSNLLL